MARFLPLNGGKEAVLLAMCWKVLHRYICIHRLLAYPRYSLSSSLSTIHLLLIDPSIRWHLSPNPTTASRASFLAPFRPKGRGQSQISPRRGPGDLSSLSILVLLTVG